MEMFEQRIILKQIRISGERVLFKTFKDFRLFAGDGSDFDLPDTKEIRKEFKVKSTKMKKNPSQGKFSSIKEVMNGFILEWNFRQFQRR